MAKESKSHEGGWDWKESFGTALEVTSKVAGFFEPIVPGANLVETSSQSS